MSGKKGKQIPKSSDLQEKLAGILNRFAAKGVTASEAYRQLYNGNKLKAGTVRQSLDKMVKRGKAKRVRVEARKGGHATVRYWPADRLVFPEWGYIEVSYE